MSNLSSAIRNFCSLKQLVANWQKLIMLADACNVCERDVTVPQKKSKYGCSYLGAGLDN